MAARTKPAPENEAEVTEEPTAETDRESIVQIVKDVLAEMTPTKEEAPTAEAEKPETARQEESRAESLVSELVKEFKAAVKGEDKPKAEVETEAQPGKKEGRPGAGGWFQRHIWGTE